MVELSKTVSVEFYCRQLGPHEMHQSYKRRRRQIIRLGQLRHCSPDVDPLEIMPSMSFDEIQRSRSSMGEKQKQRDDLTDDEIHIATAE